MKRWPVLVGCLLLLAGCGDANLAQLDEQLNDIRRSPAGQPPIEIPTIPDYRVVDYRYSDARSPFLAPESIRTQASSALLESALAPDQQRPPEPLEQFPLPSLRLVGTLRMGGQQVGMIAAPDGSVTSVRVGNYLGTDHGRITAIEPQQVRLTERIFNQQQGWQERPAVLTLE
ncbi:pilus assembly protein PilP [Vreelandella venusta]|nr:pilus assembly protein PilP [Halomonas hydrothermalis]